MITSILKLLLVLIGFISTLWNLISGLRGNKTGYKKAGFSLILTFLLISGISVIEHRIYSNEMKNRKLMLSAGREAPVGGIWLKLYDDKAYTLTYDLRSDGTKGIYKIKNDTLTLFKADTIKASFVIKETAVEEIGNTGIGDLAILKNH